LDKDIPFYFIDNIIFLIRKNFKRFENEFDEIAKQLYSIENMRMSQIPEKYILKSLVENNSLIIHHIKKLNNDTIIREIKEKIKEIELESP